MHVEPLQAIWCAEGVERFGQGRYCKSSTCRLKRFADTDTRRMLDMLTNLTCDVRSAARTQWRNRGFAASAMVILTLGMAASTGLFAVIDALVLHPVPY